MNCRNETIEPCHAGEKPAEAEEMIKGVINTDENLIICGDNKDWLTNITEKTIDLCYIDPPFFSGKARDIVWKNGTERASYDDRFDGDVTYYTETWLKPRIDAIHRILKDDGAIFVHCDWHASHKIRCVLDDIFGAKNFCNEIIWRRTPFSGSSKSRANKIPCNHDTIFYYCKTEQHKVKFKCPTLPYSKEYEKRFKNVDEKGAYRITCLKTYSEKTLRRLREAGELIEPTKEGAHYSYKQYRHKSKGAVQENTIWSGIEKIDTEEFINEFVEHLGLKIDTKEHEEIIAKLQMSLDDLWTDINMINPVAKERVYYPTQKPEELISRIIKMASNEKDVVLDCFSGGGTTAKVCSDLNRTFIVGDVSPVAIRVTATRLRKNDVNNFRIKNLSYTKEHLQNMDGKEFEKFFCDAMGWIHSGKKGRDGDIDGYDAEGNPVQIKNWTDKNVGDTEIKKFHSTLVMKGKKKGIFVAWGYTPSALSAIARLQTTGDKIEILARKPQDQDMIVDLINDDKTQVHYDEIYDKMLPKQWKIVDSEKLATKSA